MMEERLPELPKGWVWTRLGCIASIQGGFAFKSTDYKNNGIPLLRISNIKDYKVSFEEETVFLNKNFLKKYSDFLISKDDILIALSGATTGKFGIYEKDEPALLNQRVGRIKPWYRSLINSRFIFYYLNIIREKILDEAYGMAQPNISAKELEEFVIPFPPLPEQHRIVGKIEELFTRLDAGVEALKKIKAQLKRYRQAVLKYAFEGKLTQQWREANKDKLEPASILLEKIKEERKNVGANLRVRPDSGQIGQTHRSAPTDAFDLPELPEGWVWTRLGDSSEIIMGQSPPSTTYNENGNGLPFYQGKLEFGDFYPTPRKWCSSPKKIAERGDVLISVRAPVGPTNICPEKSCIGRGLASIRPLGGIGNFFILYLLRAFEQKISTQGTGTTFNAITVVQLKNIEIPLPPLPEQQKIVEEIERRFSVADEIEKVVDQSLKQAERLRQSILKRAFEGKLVPQDPTDEPAEKLLERIKREKESQNSVKQKSKRRK